MLDIRRLTSTEPLDRVSLTSRWTKYMEVATSPCCPSGGMELSGDVVLEKNKFYLSRENKIAVRASGDGRCKVCGKRHRFYLFEFHSKDQVAREWEEQVTCIPT